MLRNSKYLSIIILLGSMSCTTQYTWINPVDPNANYVSDEYECTNLANRTVPAFDSTDYTPLPATNVGSSPNLGCNNSSVSPVNCFSSTPQSIIPLGDNQLLGTTTYQRFVAQCLNKKGWQKDKVKN